MTDPLAPYLPENAPTRHNLILGDEPGAFMVWVLTECENGLMAMLSSSTPALSKLEVRAETLVWRFPSEDDRDPVILALAEIVQSRFEVPRTFTGAPRKGELVLRLRDTSRPLRLGPFCWEPEGRERAEALYTWVAEGILARAELARTSS